MDGASLVGSEREVYVRTMFDRIAEPYDALNRIISGGRDQAWRRRALKEAGVAHGMRVVDLGCGTGDFARDAAVATGPGGRVVGIDLSEGMLAVARRKLADAGVSNAEVRIGNAQDTGLPDGWADVVTMGWVLRNVGDRPATYREIRRILRPGGRVAVLDCSNPSSAVVRAGFRAYLRWVMPWAVRLRGGDRSAYRYLADSTLGFLTPEALSAELAAAGFERIRVRRFLMGAIALHVATR
ncbi:MAG TPA: ubiquinone/menaquinone biosynthesis methyltransferase [Planctomycetota bacterium]|nr:ubiquinone/menaquinone biosynthesis methyltransferase [Planctomycetota bacterium]